MIINDWNTGGNQNNNIDQYLDYGYHDLKLEHFDQGGPAELHLWWTTPLDSSEQYIAAVETGYCDCSCNELDCLGVCGGTAVLDECGVCGGDGIADGFCDCNGNIEDCKGDCGGTAVLDECGYCDGSKRSKTNK